MMRKVKHRRLDHRVRVKSVARIGEIETHHIDWLGFALPDSSATVALLVTFNLLYSSAPMKIALITGSNKGIGYEVARQLAQKGFRVFVAARNADAGQEAAKALRDAGGKAEFVMLDVADLDSIAAAAHEFGTRTDHLEVLVNNAGTLENADISVLDVSRGELERTWRTNTLGPLLVTQAFAPFLRKAGAARVINVSSGWGALSEMKDDAPAYGISKAAVNAVTRQFAAAFAPQGIPVNSVCPGWVRTDMGGRNATRSVAEGADTIVWLATEAPLSLTGQFLRDRRPIPW
jgi:NAD(P)-dependent dehydrogenase (short-subunit alcohol dehydrogenase family)